MALLVVALIYLLPLYWMISGSFELRENTIRTPPNFFPNPPTLENYRKLIFETPTVRWFLNSVIVAAIISTGAVITSTTAGYAFGVLRFPGREPLFWLVLVSMALPSAVTVVPLFLIMREIGWIDTYPGMIAPLVAYPFGVFLVRQFMHTIPHELFDAAKVDGASGWAVFRRIAVPLVRPAVGAVAIFAFMAGWTDYIWQLIVVNDTDMKTLPVGIATVVRGYETVDLGMTMAGATIAFIPMLIIFIAFQGYFIRGITGGATKG